MKGEHKTGAGAQFPPLELETRSHVPTEQAAYYLIRRIANSHACARVASSGVVTA